MLEWQSPWWVQEVSFHAFIFTSLCSCCQDLRSQASPWNPVSIPHTSKTLTYVLNISKAQIPYNLSNYSSWRYAEDSVLTDCTEVIQKMLHTNFTMGHPGLNSHAYILQCEGFVQTFLASMWPSQNLNSDLTLKLTFFTQLCGGCHWASMPLIRSLRWEGMQTPKNSRNRPDRYLRLFIEWWLNFVCFTYTCNLLCSVW